MDQNKRVVDGHTTLLTSKSVVDVYADWYSSNSGVDIQADVFYFFPIIDLLVYILCVLKYSGNGLAY